MKIESFKDENENELVVLSQHTFVNANIISLHKT